MRAIILAAGMGTRLRPYTEHCPKALVPLLGKPLLEYQLEILRSSNITDIAVVTGYCAEQFGPYQLTVFNNMKYQSTNMLYSLMQAEDWLNGDQDVLICYGDIIYTTEVINRLMASDAEIAVSADLDWQLLWQLRMEDPLTDAESFIYNAETLCIKQLGKKMTHINQAQAQYIGLLKLSSAIQPAIRDVYNKLDPKLRETMYMTDFIQKLIDIGLEVKASLHQNGWLEVDSVQDLHNYEHMPESTINQLKLGRLLQKKA
ncbi:phosphocholine cytidylyltransferase family protein [Rheinheimera mesophila]|uniref:Phosphocholine cytidylyltransferase family protein n=1 Tax=Rheinheimera mesophila TaxID=1547515 RepID=A0A3P3QPM2_9GAMM|nr:phosphocholine cytidylyltransferase family protein [Rheinheimera mesophila]KKL01551.1 hypothetical protein SD53_09505 [Rheinheimera mesophila]RRJ23202.1 phosphocholine cytidylyltransferase family protein [Rheinheimera mesophila]